MVNLENISIDWALLRLQKSWLWQHQCQEADGLLNLIDAIQDQAVLSGRFTEQQVFGLQQDSVAET